MKTFIATALLALSFSSMASSYIRPSSMSCDELNALLEESKSIGVIHGLLGISRGTMWADLKDAEHFCADVRQPTLRAQDGLCVAGYMCVPVKSTIYR